MGEKFDSEILVIMMTGYADIESAIASMKSGASDYISKPIEPEQLFQKIEEAFQTQLNRQRKDIRCNELIKPPGKQYAELLKYLDNVVETKSHLLISGNRGTGKSSVVRYLHDKGFDLSRPLVVIDIEQIESDRELRRHLTGSADDASLLMERFGEARGILHPQCRVARSESTNELLSILPVLGMMILYRLQSFGEEEEELQIVDSQAVYTSREEYVVLPI